MSLVTVNTAAKEAIPSPRGYKDCLRVNSAARVRTLSSARNFVFCNNFIVMASKSSTFTVDQRSTVSDCVTTSCYIWQRQNELPDCNHDHVVVKVEWSSSLTASWMCHLGTNMFWCISSMVPRHKIGLLHSEFKVFNQCECIAEPHNSTGWSSPGVCQGVLRETIGSGVWETRTPGLDNTLVGKEVSFDESIKYLPMGCSVSCSKVRVVN